MDTQQKTFRFIILIPHRDALKPLEEYRQKLFSLGIPGAHSFPLAAPLAEVTRTFNREELKELARNIRELTRKSDGKILSRALQLRTTQNCSLGTAIVSSSGISFFGPLLNLPSKEDIFPETAKNKLVSLLLPPVLCAAIVGPQVNSSDKNFSSEEAPVVSFRAASLANLAIHSLADTDYSFEWKISPPVWLPNLHARHYGKLY